MKFEPNKIIDATLPVGVFEGILEKVEWLHGTESKEVDKTTGQEVTRTKYAPITKAGQEANAISFKLKGFAPFIIKEQKGHEDIFESNISKINGYFGVHTMKELADLKDVPVKGYKKPFSRVYASNASRDRKVFNGYNYIFGNYTPAEVVDADTGEITEA